MTDKEKFKAEINAVKLIIQKNKAQGAFSEGYLIGQESVLEHFENFVNSMQEKPKECMYARDNYTDEDRKVLCDGCEEECEYKHREESVNNGLDLGCGVIWKEEEPVSEDLEEAAKIYARGEYDRKNPSSLPWQCKGCYSPLIYAFKAGAKWHKEQMMKDAVDGGCFSYRNGYKHISCDIDENLTNIKLGDKVKLIIIKED